MKAMVWTKFGPPDVLPTGCATSYKQVGDRVPCGFTSDLHSITCLPARWRFATRNSLLVQT